MNKKIKFTALALSVLFVMLSFAGCGLTPPDEYVIDQDQVDSITKVVGSRKLVEEYSSETDTMKTLVYRYTGIASVQDDLMKYADFLRNEAGFISLKNTDLTQTAQADSYAQFGRASTEEGMVFVITIAYRDKSYDIQVDKTAGTINQNATESSGTVPADTGGEVTDNAAASNAVASNAVASDAAAQ